MADALQRLKQRKLMQWALAYLAGAWVALQVLGLAQDSYGWPRGVMQLAFGVLALGFVVTLVSAWYHGDRGVQRVSSVELLILALLLAVGGGLLGRGDAKAVLRFADTQTDPSSKLWYQAAAYAVGGNRAKADAPLQALIDTYGQSQAFYVAEIYALRQQPDAMFEWLDRAWANHDTAISGLLGDPLILRYRHDPRFAAYRAKVSLPALEPMPAPSTTSATP